MQAAKTLPTSIEEERIPRAEAPLFLVLPPPCTPSTVYPLHREPPHCVPPPPCIPSPMNPPTVYPLRRQQAVMLITVTAHLLF
eukprot:573135-Pelagomonas_calceolata.AAC.5